MPERLLITANSPGEVALVRGLARRAVGRIPVEVLLLPCTFATGRERHVAEGLEGVSRVYSLSELPRIMWRGLPGRTHLLHIGGDLMYSAFLSWRWGWPTWSYMWTRPWWNRFFLGFFTRNDWGRRWLLKRRVPEQQILQYGDLVADATWPSGPPVPPPEPGLITFLPGSREAEVRNLAPYFLEVAQLLSARHPNLRFQLLISPHIPRERWADLLGLPPDDRMGGVAGRLEGDRLVGAGASLTVRAGQPAAVAGSTVAVAIPGTKTAEAGLLEVPVVTIVPLNQPEELPGAGLLGWLDLVPGGDRLKGHLLLRGKARLGLLAQPNLLAGERFMPEIVEKMNAPMLADPLSDLLGDPARLEAMRGRLRELYAAAWGASGRMLDTILGSPSQP